jgi:glycerol-3-phosphate dehydrogenase (NAD(P)+)
VKLSVLGAGAWGTALAISASHRHDTVLWARDAAQAALMQTQRSNLRYLDQVDLPPALQVTADFDRAIAHARGGMLIVATPMAGLASVLQAVHRAIAGPRSPGLFWLCKGFQDGSGHLGHEVAAAVWPGGRVGVLSGPSFAQEVARGQPTALVAASADLALCESAVELLHCDHLRIYTSGDPIGVEVGGAVKNVMAIAAGLADGLQLGLNARAALITRGLAEMVRLGVALGGRAETFMGLSGLGDLVLTATGDLSRNRTVGLRLAQGLPLTHILNELGHVAEGVLSAPTVLKRAQALGVELPITAAVVEVLDGRSTPQQGVERLMGRESRPER